MTTILKNKRDMYNKYDYDLNIPNDMLNNKLFCTFTDKEGMDSLVESLVSRYKILYDKLFILEILDKDEFVVTYNVDQGNIDNIPENTILVHRKKDTNTLYTINALNELIKKLNGGYLDKTYKINWYDYKNCILLTQHNELSQLNTKIYKIIHID